MSIALELDRFHARVEASVTALASECRTLAKMPVGASRAVHARPRLGTGWASFLQVLPKGASFGPLQLGDLPTQTDVRNRWPDGSIFIAQVTAKSHVAGEYPLTTGPAMSGAFVPVWPSASVSFVTGGLIYVAELPAFDPVNPWLVGPLVRETRVVVTPVAGGVPHPLLHVVFDVRSFVNGSHRLDVCFQNVKDVAEGAPVAYDATVTVNGTLRYTRLNVVQPYMTRGRKVFGAGGYVEAEVTPDLEPFFATGLLPRYLPTIANTRPTAQGAAFDLFGYGPIPVDMGNPGGRPDLAPLPNVTAQYLVHQQPEQKAYLLATADISGSWSGHVTEADGRTLISLDAYPTYWLDGRAGTRTAPVYGIVGPNASVGRGTLGAGQGWLEVAHLPSLCFVPYLLTGDRFYLDQMKFWANFTMLKAWPGTGERESGKGILMEHQPRGFGWGLRTLAEVSAVMPDDDPMRDYFRSRLQHNLDFLDRYAKTVDGGPHEFVFVGKFPVNGRGNRYTTLWQSAYVGYALDRCQQLGFGPVAAMRDRIVRTQVKFFTSEADGYPRSAGAPYYPDVANAGRWFSIREVYDETKATNAGGAVTFPPFAGFYGTEARLMLQIGVREGVPGAQAALDYLLAQPNVLRDINERSGWAVMA